MIQTPNKHVCYLASYRSVLNGEATHINFIVFGWTRPGIELTIYCTQREQQIHFVPLFREMTIVLNNVFSFDSCKPARLNNLPDDTRNIVSDVQKMTAIGAPCVMVHQLWCTNHILRG